MNCFAGKNLHFVGIGGIGMSGLAQMCQYLGANVSGSDRAVDAPENGSIFNALRKYGIKIYPQDGSFAKFNRPDFLIYSTAIEEDNPDFISGASIERLHRSEALSLAINSINCEKTAAICGSCGKTTVTAMLGETLYRLQEDPVIINGGALKCFADSGHIGNFKSGKGGCLVFEADESDKSLLKYSVDYAIILNIGTDHYSKEELLELFAEFLTKVKIGAVMSRQVFSMLQGRIPAKLKISVFEDELPSLQGEWFVSEYSSEGNSCSFTINNNYIVSTSQIGKINALNICAVSALLELMGFSITEATTAAGKFSGVKRRGEFVGYSNNGALVFDDYAHNPEKIASAINSNRERITGNIYAIFQPHGYAPLRFMKEELFKVLENNLQREDKFFLMEPYYAGGTSSFTPSAIEVMDLWRSMGADRRYECGQSREILVKELLPKLSKDDLVLIMGARDNSLPDFAAKFIAE